MTDSTKLRLLFSTVSTHPIEKVEALTPAGSNRQYVRITTADSSYIGVIGTSEKENKAFLSFANSFAAIGLNTPRVLAQTDDNQVYIQQDLGNQSLFELIDKDNRDGCLSADTVSLIKQSLCSLAWLQTEADKVVDYSLCYPVSSFDKRSIMWDLNYFKYCFLKPAGVEFDEALLEDDFERLAGHLLQAQPWGFMYRDFQSRNIMISNGEPFFIDFQGGRRGPVIYDLVSFLWQARAGFSPNLRRQMTELYISKLALNVQFDAEAFRCMLKHFVLFRTMQVLGAYGFRGLVERKPHFIASIPPAIANLKEVLNEDFSDYAYLKQVLTMLTMIERFSPQLSSDGLTVRISSFSFKKGIPEDPSGNGGGFVFDCRAMDNPGRYEQYKRLTGMDKPVIDFLEERGEIQLFLNNVYQLVDRAVECYLQRGFTSLMVSFGCTGGQHRSVYSAEHLAEHLKSKYKVNILLSHRELK